MKIIKPVMMDGGIGAIEYDSPDGIPAGSWINPDTAREYFPALCKRDGLEYNYQTQLPRQAVLDVCPVCSRPVIVRHGHTVCTSGMCRERVIEDCC